MFRPHFAHSLRSMRLIQRAAVCVLLLAGLAYIARPTKRHAQTEPNLIAADSAGRGYVWTPPAQRENCVTETQQPEIARQLAEFEKHAIATPDVVQQTLQPYTFYPQAGTIHQDLFLLNYVDLDSTGGIRDWDCSDYTYDGHNGADSIIRTFLEQEIGVPIFAALDGTVTQTHDGEPDMNTAQLGQAANFVTLSHGNGQNTQYLHMKKGSVAVSVGQAVKAGTQLGLTASSGNSSSPHLHFATYINGVLYEPYAGRCRTGTSNWVVQTPIRRELYVRDFFFSNTSLIGPGNVLFETQTHVGTFLSGTQLVPFRVFLAGLPANSSYRIRYRRPDGSIALERTGPLNNSDFLRITFHSWDWNINHNVTGTWRLQYDINDQNVVDAPYQVVAAANQIVNRPPNPIQLAFDPPAPQSNQVVFCRVQTSLLFEDPDYEIVRYRYQWRINGNIVRDVTSAALSDAIPKDRASNGDTLTCTVTPSDGQASGQQTTITIKYGMPAAAVTSAASYSRVEQAPESIVAAFGARLATTTAIANSLPLPTQLAGTTVKVRDALGVERLAPLFFVAPTQINYLVPPGTAPGFATVTFTAGDGTISIGGGEIARVAPGLFTANASGQGAPAAIALRVRANGAQSYEPVAQFDAAQNRFVPAPLALGPEGDQLFLILYGTGLRFNTGLSSVLATLGGVNAEVFYAGTQGDFVGLDQVNLRIPRSLAGRGEIEAALVVSTKAANPVRINIR